MRKLHAHIVENLINKKSYVYHNPKMCYPDLSTLFYFKRTGNKLRSNCIFLRIMTTLLRELLISMIEMHLS